MEQRAIEKGTKGAKGWRDVKIEGESGRTLWKHWSGAEGKMEWEGKDSWRHGEMDGGDERTRRKVKWRVGRKRMIRLLKLILLKLFQKEKLKSTKRKTL